MEKININGDLFVVKRKFSYNRIKNENALADIKHYYGADFLIKDVKNQRYILASKIDDAVILEETEKEK